MSKFPTKVAPPVTCYPFHTVYAEVEVNDGAFSADLEPICYFKLKSDADILVERLDNASGDDDGDEGDGELSPFVTRFTQQVEVPFTWCSQLVYLDVDQILALKDRIFDDISDVVESLTRE